MTIDRSDVSQLESQGELLDVITHELGHVLGIGTIWDANGRLTGTRTSNPLFVGTQATTAYNATFGTQHVGVPVEAGGGPGTALGHWRESVFGNELMVGTIHSGGMALELHHRRVAGRPRLSGEPGRRRSLHAPRPQFLDRRCQPICRADRRTPAWSHQGRTGRPRTAVGTRVPSPMRRPSAPPRSRRPTRLGTVPPRAPPVARRGTKRWPPWTTSSDPAAGGRWAKLGHEGRTVRVPRLPYCTSGDLHIDLRIDLVRRKALGDV